MCSAVVPEGSHKIVGNASFSIEDGEEKGLRIIPDNSTRVAEPAEGSMEEHHSVAIVGDNPEALLLSVLYAEAGISNYLVGPFGNDGRTHANRPGLECKAFAWKLLSVSYRKF